RGARGTCPSRPFSFPPPGADPSGRPDRRRAYARSPALVGSSTVKTGQPHGQVERSARQEARGRQGAGRLRKSSESAGRAISVALRFTLAKQPRNTPLVGSRGDGRRPGPLARRRTPSRLAAGRRDPPSAAGGERLTAAAHDGR